VPGPTGVTTPEELTVATEVLLLLQMPPDMDAVSVALLKLPQITLAPVTAAAGFTVTTRYA